MESVGRLEVVWRSSVFLLIEKYRALKLLFPTQRKF